MKIALFGGTFDPIHNGHLAIAREAADKLALDQVLFIPSGRPPHRESSPQASFEDRFQMVQLACRADARFLASRREDPTVLGKGKTYSIDTIEKIRSELTPEDTLHFLIGQDAFEELSIWHRLEDVVRQVEFIVATRVGTEAPPLPAGAAALARARWLEGINVPVSATVLRERLAAGEDVSESLPPGVSEYIHRHRLYQK